MIFARADEFLLRYDAVGCCEYPLVTDESPSTDVIPHRIEVYADLPGPWPCCGIVTTHDLRVQRRRSTIWRSTCKRVSTVPLICVVIPSHLYSKLLKFVVITVHLSAWVVVLSRAIAWLYGRYELWVHLPWAFDPVGKRDGKRHLHLNASVGGCLIFQYTTGISSVELILHVSLQTQGGPKVPAAPFTCLCCEAMARHTVLFNIAGTFCSYFLNNIILVVYLDISRVVQDFLKYCASLQHFGAAH